MEDARVPFLLSLKAIRVNTDLTQEEFGHILGVTKSTVCNWELGKTEPTLSELRQISKITKIPMDFIKPQNPFKRDTV